MLHWDSKKPTDVDDYDIDWSQRLAAGDSITSSSWSVAGTSLTLSGSTFTPQRTKIFLTGGADGRTYVLTNTIATVMSGPLHEYVQITVRDE